MSGRMRGEKEPEEDLRRLRAPCAIPVLQSRDSFAAVLRSNSQHGSLTNHARPSDGHIGTCRNHFAGDGEGCAGLTGRHGYAGRHGSRRGVVA